MNSKNFDILLHVTDLLTECKQLLREMSSATEKSAKCYLDTEKKVRTLRLILQGKEVEETQEFPEEIVSHKATEEVQMEEREEDQRIAKIVSIHRTRQRSPSFAAWLFNNKEL
ncbi:hypothetical protein H6501_02915 [Candidatus Woesearchaeota archaeon]|nr:hypothetical protein [Nanoarchaeota archaeon]MCB9370523.1 hypothetical protein [Candidatus Woesearchaeota archaeon]USN43599.1 MAG: hypothetical protein H6500_04360 [Candidatus Woesearchaeota archaeon]